MHTASDKSYSVITYEGIQDWWDTLHRTNSEDPSEPELHTELRYFHRWDPENQIAYWGKLDYLGSQVTEQTDTTFLDNVSELVGQYVLVTTKSRSDGMIAPNTLLSIQPVEEKVGVVTAVENGQITIDQTTYSYAERLNPILVIAGDPVVY